LLPRPGQLLEASAPLDRLRGGGPNVFLPPRLRQAQLLLAFTVVFLAHIVLVLPAAGTTDPLLKLRVQLVCLRDGHAAGMALIVTALLQAVIDCHTIIEDEALALPQRLLLGYLLEVLQNASLQVIDLLEAQLLEIGRGLLAADAAGAEHRHLALPRRV